MWGWPCCLVPLGVCRLSLASGLESNMHFLAPNRWAVIWDFHLIWGRPLVFHSVTESEIHCSLLKSQETGQFGGKESLLYFGCWQPRKWAGQTPVQRLTPSPDSQGARPFIGCGRGLHAEMAQATPTVILKLIMGGLTGVILIVLNIIFSSRFVFSHFLGASSQNCSSLCRDYGVVIM